MCIQMITYDANMHVVQQNGILLFSKNEYEHTIGIFRIYAFKVCPM